MIPRQTLRVFAVGFGQNVASFLAWTVIPVWSAYEGGAGASQSGLLPALSGLTYIFVALRAGKLSDRLGRGTLARVGMAGFALFCGLGWWFHSVAAFTVLGILNGFSMALIWPALQARIGDDSTADDLERNLGNFSFSWSIGKTIGVFAAASIYEALGLDALLVCGVVGLLLVPVIPAGKEEKRGGGTPLVRDDHHPPALRAAHSRVGWCANFAAYGMGSTVVYLYPNLLRAAGRPESDHGIVLGTAFLAQTAGFWLFGRFAGWRYRFAPVAGWLLVGAGCLAVIGMGTPPAVALPAAAVLGLALGQAYAASVYYSVHSEEDRGARAGIHEAVIGAGDFGIPLLGGLAAGAAGWSPTPFLFAAGVAAIAMAVAWRVVRRVEAGAGT